MLTSYMPPMRSCSRDSSMRSVLERTAAGAGGIDPQALQLPVAARAAGLQPDLVQAQDIAVAMRGVALAHLVERVHHGLEFLGQLREYARQYPPAAMGCGLRQSAVRAAAHGDVVVDIDEFPGKAAREEAGDEQCHVAQALQR